MQQQPPNGGYGNYVVIDHGSDADGNNIRSIYALLQTNSILVRVGQAVSQGEQIARSGISGSVYRPSLRFVMLKNSNPTDPDC